MNRILEVIHGQNQGLMEIHLFHGYDFEDTKEISDGGGGGLSISGPGDDVMNRREGVASHEARGLSLFDWNGWASSLESAPITKVQRWLDLIAYLVGRRLPVSVEEFMERLPTYARDWAG